MKEVLFMSAVMIALALAGAAGSEGSAESTAMLHTPPALPASLAPDLAAY